MRKHVLILMVIFLGISISGFGQIKVNSAGRTFFGSGTGTTSYGAINLTADGTANGISFTGTSTNRYNLFKYTYGSRDEFYITPNQSTSKGLKIANDGGVFIATDGLYGASGDGALTVVSSIANPVIRAYGAHTTSSKIVFQAIPNRDDSYAFMTQFRSDWSIRFYVKGDGTVYAKNGYIQSSDISKKEDVKRLENSLDRILALSPISFYYKDFMEKSLEDLSQVSMEANMENDTLPGRVFVKPETVEQLKKEASRKRIGLIAQEVEEIVPEVVRTLDDGTKGIMYSDLVSLLIEGVKELKLLVDEQKNINEKQEKYIDELEERLVVLEASVLTEKQFAEKTITDIVSLGREAKLYQNTPNPFDKETEIKYTIPANSSAYIGIYDLNGKQLKKYNLYEKQQGTITISASEFAAGIYLYSLIVDAQEIDTKRMILTD